MTDFTKAAQPPFLRYDAVENRTDETWFIAGADGEIIEVLPGQRVQTVPRLEPQ
jgi:hypothetical protein